MPGPMGAAAMCRIGEESEAVLVYVIDDPGDSWDPPEKAPWNYVRLDPEVVKRRLALFRNGRWLPVDRCSEGNGDRDAVIVPLRPPARSG